MCQKCSSHKHATNIVAINIRQEYFCRHLTKGLTSQLVVAFLSNKSAFLSNKSGSHAIAKQLEKVTINTNFSSPDFIIQFDQTRINSF